VDAEALWDELVRFEAEIARIEMRFIRVTESLFYIQDREGILIRQQVEQVIDILNDALGANGFSRQISSDFNRGFRKYPPSVHSVRSILWTIRAARRHIEQNRMLLNQ
jgi:hypothetical protein